MAGGYTHLTLIRKAINTATNRVYGSASDPEWALGKVLETWGRFAYLGGVSPDYPYLAFDAPWADRMHKGGTDRMIRAAMASIHPEYIASANASPWLGRTKWQQGREWQQKFAWLLGYVAHVVADVVVHPVVNIRVGVYEKNKDDHRRCEMNQDVAIYHEITGLDLHHSDNMKTEIRGCGQAMDLNDDVETLWSRCLTGAYGASPGGTQIDRWHGSFIKMVDIAENAREIPVFGRHLVEGAYAYPSLAEAFASGYLTLDVPTSARVDGEQQPVDRGNPLPFRRVFDKALAHIDEAWRILADDLFRDGAVGTRHGTVFGDWSLDTGIDNATGALRLWPEHVAL